MELKALYKLFLNSKGISTDSRSIQPGELFVALSGPNFNGNRFAAAALERGALASIVDQKDFAAPDRCVLVNDSLSILQKLSRYHRDQFSVPILAITGSNGKTTTKELVQELLSQKYKVHATKGNLNNHIGVPLTLLAMGSETDIAVIEMGANHPYEIQTLCEIANPDFGLITNVSKAHLEGFKSLEGVVKTKSELYHHLKQNDGIAFINQDDPLLISALPPSLKHIKYSLSQTYDGKLQLQNQFPFLKFDYFRAQKNMVLESNLYGTYNQLNIAAAISIGEYFDLKPEDIQKGLSSYIPQNNRSQLIRTKNSTIILDAYNANPVSMRASISHFAICLPVPKILILGEMAELGEDSLTEHLELIHFIRQWQWEKIFLVGNQFVKVNPSDAHVFKNTSNLMDYFGQFDIPNDCSFLLKGSRVAHLESLLPMLNPSPDPEP